MIFEFPLPNEPGAAQARFSFMIRVTLILALLIAGCGPMTIPAIRPLDPEQQAVVDGMWNNMLTPDDRLDRDLLLDVILINQLHQLGADRVRYVAIKETAAGTVTMVVDFDRARRAAGRPDSGTFTVTLSNPAGAVIRRDVYTGNEVLERAGAALRPEPEGSGNFFFEWVRRVEWQVRQARITAATRPVGG